jgi:hypothetical protein
MPNGITYGLFGGRTRGHQAVTRKIEQTNSAAIRSTRDTGGYAVKDNPLTQSPRGSGLVATSGDSPVSHVTPDAVTMTPDYSSRHQEQWEGNITGNTVARTTNPNSIIRIQPRMGFGRGGVDTSLVRHDAPIPSLVSGNSNGTPTHNPTVKDFTTIDFTTKNPQATQNQDPNPRVQSLTQKAG